MTRLTPSSSLLMLACGIYLSGCVSSSHAGPAKPTPAGDPAHTDADKYAVLYENAVIRVLRYHDEPGAKTHQHRHPNFFMYALAPFQRKLTFGDGSVKERSFKAGEFAWMPTQVHTGENTGTLPTEVLLVELKLELGEYPGCSK